MLLKTSHYTLTVENGRYELRQHETTDNEAWVNTRRGDLTPGSKLALFLGSQERLSKKTIDVTFNGTDIGSMDVSNQESVTQLVEIVQFWNAEVGPTDSHTARIVCLLNNATSLWEPVPLRIQALTWNCCGILAQVPTDAWDGVFGKDPADIIVLAFQETDPLSRNLVSNQQTLAVSMDRLTKNLPDHKIVSNVQLLGLMLLIAARHELAPHLSDFKRDSSGTGFLKMWGNKGAVLTRFTLFKDSLIEGGVEFSIVNCHLSAGEGNTQDPRREWELGEISRKFEIENIVNPRLSDLQLDSESFGRIGSLEEEDAVLLDFDIELDASDVSDQSDVDIEPKPQQEDNETTNGKYRIVLPDNPLEPKKVVIVLGDLNYRLHLTPPFVKDLIMDRSYSRLLQHDGLSIAKSKERIFTDFYESPIHFPPTFKYKPHTNRYTARIPSYTDRVLIRSECQLEVENYNSLSLKHSDHRPVSAAYALEVPRMNDAKRAALVEETLRMVDLAENRSRPIIHIKPQTLELKGSVLSIQTAHLTLSSSGRSAAVFRIVAPPDLILSPDFGTLNPGTHIKVLVKTQLKPGSTHEDHILIVKSQHGPDTFIEVAVNVTPTCLSKPLNELSKNTEPPIQVQRLVDYLLLHKASGLFKRSCEPRIVQQIFEWLDADQDLDEEVLQAANNAAPHAGAHAVAKALILLLECLPAPLISFNNEAKVQAPSKLHANTARLLGMLIRATLDLNPDRNSILVSWGYWVTRKSLDPHSCENLIEEMCRMRG